MVSAIPPSPGSPRIHDYPVTAATSNALATARQAQHIADPNLPLIGFANFLPGFGNACFRSAFISLLINLPPLSGWIVSNTQGQLDNSPTMHLLENVIREYFDTNLPGKQARVDGAIQRWYRHFNLVKPVGPDSGGDVRYPADTQQDAGEVLASLMEDIQAELTTSGNTAAMGTLHAPTDVFMVARVTCTRCNRATSTDNPDQYLRKEHTLRVSLAAGNIRSFEDLIQTGFTPSSALSARCSRCAEVTPRSAQWQLHTLPEVLIIDVDQAGYAPGLVAITAKLGIQVPDIPEELDLGAYVYGVAGSTARYRLMGVVNHQGTNSNKGHYVSHVRHTSGKWFLLNDATVSPSSTDEMQAYNYKLQANQMIPRMIAYVKIHDDEDANPIATRAVNPQPGPRAFQQPQIVYDY